MNEARTNPEKNPRTPWYDQLKSLSTRDDLYVTFTAIDKVGVNPQTQYIESPIGIYAYPLKEMYKYILADAVPSFSGMPYVHLLQQVDTPYDVSSPIDVKEYLIKLKKVSLRLYKKLSTPKEYKDFSTSYDKYQQESIAKYDEKITKFCTLWAVVRGIAELIAGLTGRTTPMVWNVLLQGLGFTIISDKKGKSIIDSAEPIQAVFLSKKYLKHLKTFNNSRDDMKLGNSGQDSITEEDVLDRVIKAVKPKLVTKLYYGAFGEDPNLRSPKIRYFTMKVLTDRNTKNYVYVIEKILSGVNGYIDKSTSVNHGTTDIIKFKLRILPETFYRDMCKAVKQIDDLYIKINGKSI